VVKSVAASVACKTLPQQSEASIIYVVQGLLSSRPHYTLINS